MQLKQQSQTNQQPINHTPAHVAIIMDGNGRWAQQRGLPRLAGHRAGTENIRRVTRCLSHQGIRFLTLYAFSTENWSRPQDEVRGLLGILGEAILRETEALHRDGVRLNHLGRLDRLPPELREGVLQAVQHTSENPGLTLSVAFDYGGREEILQAVRRMLAAGVSAEAVDEPLFQKYLYTAALPDPDLIIRTAGEMRLSNFLLWQAAYSEYYTTPVLWPDVDEEEIAKALAVYRQRERRFGGICPPDGGK
jgi:undecaprenyl diphosphate synthase